MTPHTTTVIFFEALRKAQWLFSVRVKQRGFTLIEILIVVGIIILFLGLSILQLRSFQQVSYLQGTGKEVVAALRLAKSRTLASEEALQYGVYFDAISIPSQYILFQGSSYVARDTVKDEIAVLQKTIEISAIFLDGGNEVVFERITGSPSATGTITFRQVANPSRTKLVSVLTSGTIEEDVSSAPSDASRVVDSRHVHVFYQGRDIDTGTEDIRLVFPDTTFTIVLADNIVAGQIFWEGDVMSEGENQHLKIHTHELNDIVLGRTQFSLHREGQENTKSLLIELSGDVAGDVISYDALGNTTQGTSIYAKTPQLQ